MSLTPEKKAELTARLGYTKDGAASVSPGALEDATLLLELNTETAYLRGILQDLSGHYCGCEEEVFSDGSRNAFTCDFHRKAAEEGWIDEL